MAVSAKDIKLLWGKAAGICSFPGCAENCIKELSSEPLALGEMAHVIAQSPLGLRGRQKAGSDGYENLILMCPTHHNQIDRAPSQTYPAELLQRWKADHEKMIAERVAAPSFGTLGQLSAQVSFLLMKNKAVWDGFGPESEAAKRNPVSSAFALWELRKLSTIVPNNRLIISYMEAHIALLPKDLQLALSAFIEHAAAFERNCYSRVEDTPRFPLNFRELVERYSDV